METGIISLILLLAVAKFAFHFLKHYFQFHPRQQLPPGPNPFQVLYYIPQLISEPHVVLRNFARSHGPLISFRLGNQLMVVASSPEAAKQFCRTHDKILSGRHLSTVYHNLPGTIDSSIVLSPECSKSWKLLRSIGQNCVFSGRALEINAGIRQAKVMELVNHLRSQEGEVINLEGVMFATLANVISSILTSNDLFDIEEQQNDRYKMMMHLADEVIEKTITLGLVDFLPVLKRIDFWSDEKAMDMHRKIKLTWGSVISDRRSSRSSTTDSLATHDFLDTVIADGSFSDNQIRNALMEILVGATDSTTITTVWVIVELLRNPDMLSKVRTELKQAVGGDIMSAAVLSECNYFQACIKETLRLHGPAPLMVPHRALAATKVNNYVIPKDSVVLVNSWALARDPEHWEEATSFKPERFLESKIGYRGTHFEYLPFGTGLRMCPGSGVAFRNIEMVVGSLLHHFDWRLPNGEDLRGIDMNEKFSTTLKRKNPLLLIPTLRKQ